MPSSPIESPPNNTDAPRFIAYFMPDGAIQNVAVDAKLIADCRKAGIDLSRSLGAMLGAYAIRHNVTQTASGRYMWKSCLGLSKEAVVQRLLKDEIAQRVAQKNAGPVSSGREGVGP